jgi:arsenate reductase
MIQIVHNTRCGKSRNCLAFIENTNIEFEIINYLSTTLSTEELKEIIRKLNIEPLDLVRQKEKIWIDNYKGKNMTEEQIIEAMVDNPILIERPIVIKGDKAIIARELDKLSNFI